MWRRPLSRSDVEGGRFSAQCLLSVEWHRRSHMLRTYARFWNGLLLVVGLIFSALVASTVQAAPVATVPDCSFTPAQGGPGTLVHAQLDQWYSSTPVEVGFAVPITP